MTTQRQLSIAKMFSIMDSVKFDGGDWDDFLATKVAHLPGSKEFPGITPEEFSIIDDAFSCPRAASDLLSELHEEIEDIDFPAPFEEDIKQLEAVIHVLKELQKRSFSDHDLPKVFWGEGLFSKLDAVGVITQSKKFSEAEDVLGLPLETITIKIGEIKIKELRRM